MNPKVRAWLLVLLVAVLSAGAVGTIAWYRGRPLPVASVIRALPAQDAVIVYIDFAALRQTRLMERIFGSRSVEDEDYRRFVDKTGFNFRDDLDYAAVALGPSGRYALLHGAFDWAKLRSYVTDQNGTCNSGVCTMDAVTPTNAISFRAVQSKLMAFAVAKDHEAVRRIDNPSHGPERQLPSAPVWIQIPGALLKPGNATLPAGTQMFARSMEQANSVLLMLGNENGHLTAQLDITCPSGESAAAAATQLSDATARLRQAIELEHQTPNPADLSGLLTSGSFHAEGSHALGRWIIQDAFLDNIFNGAVH